MMNIRDRGRFFGRWAALAAGVAAIFAVVIARADWPMHRGNAERTGTQDAEAAAIHKPKVLWSYKAQEHFVASPVPQRGVLFVSALAPFNTAQVHALALEDMDAAGGALAIKRGAPLWTKASPFITLPTVSSPAIFEDMVIFGDGLHQTDGAVLYAFDFTSGRPLWRYTIEGKLVHMEGAPVVDATFPGGPAVFIGAGDAGVIAVSAKRAVLEGQEVELAKLRETMEARWQDLLKKFEEQKKKDPDFAVPPSDDALPAAKPKLLWQKGVKQWHVDAALALSGDKLLVASAYLDDDKCGKRAIVCLDKKTGNTLWECPVDFNPWAGATISGTTAIVGCSSIRFDANQIDQAKGQLVAIDMATGNIRWKQDLSGGALSAVPVKDGLAVVTTTNGRIRAYDVASGVEKWKMTNKNAFFAGSAVAGTGDTGVVYAADILGNLMAVRLADGALLWSMDVGRDAMVQAPGMVFGSPVVCNGAVYLATCNVAGEHADQPSAVVCVVDESFKPKGERPKVVVDKAHRWVDLPARVAPRKLPTLKDIYPLEVVATYPTPQGQKAHETVVITDVLPSDVHKALVELGGKAGAPIKGEGTPTGSAVRVWLVVTGPSGKDHMIPMEKTIIDTRTGKTLPPLRWFFTGSALRQVDPDRPEKSYGADVAGTFVTIYPVTDETVVQSDLSNEAQSLLHLEMNRNIVPEEGTAVRLRIEVMP